MDTLEKIYCTGHDNNDALIATLANQRIIMILWQWQL